MKMIYRSGSGNWTLMMSTHQQTLKIMWIIQHDECLSSLPNLFSFLYVFQICYHYCLPERSGVFGGTHNISRSKHFQVTFSDIMLTEISVYQSPHPEEILSLFHHECVSSHFDFTGYDLHTMIFFSCIFLYVLFQINDRNQWFIFLHYSCLKVFWRCDSGQINILSFIHPPVISVGVGKKWYLLYVIKNGMSLGFTRLLYF